MKVALNLFYTVSCICQETRRTTKQTMQEDSQENMIMYVSKLTEQVSGWGARVRSCSTLSPFNPFYPQPTPHHHHARTCSTLTWFRLIRVDSRRAYVWVKWFLSSPAATSIDITEASHLQKKLAFVAFWLMVQTMSLLPDKVPVRFTLLLWETHHICQPTVSRREL